MEATPNPSSSSTSVHTLNIAHVLFMDIVAYSQLPMDEQTHLIELLQKIVRNTDEFAAAGERGSVRTVAQPQPNDRSRSCVKTKPFWEVEKPSGALSQPELRKEVRGPSVHPTTR
jgi:hypothetical protein